MSEDLHWREPSSSMPPSRPEVQAVVQFVRDFLLAAGLDSDIEQDDPVNPDYWSFVTRDAAGYVNLGLLSWSPSKQAVVYAAYDPVRARHDEMELVPEEESRCWWMPGSAEVFAWHLTGRVREIVVRVRAEEIRLTTLEDDKAA